MLEPLLCPCLDGVHLQVLIGTVIRNDPYDQLLLHYAEKSGAVYRDGKGSRVWLFQHSTLCAVFMREA